MRFIPVLPALKIAKGHQAVIPAKAGIQWATTRPFVVVNERRRDWRGGAEEQPHDPLDSRVRRNDGPYLILCRATETPARRIHRAGFPSHTHSITFVTVFQPVTVEGLFVWVPSSFAIDFSMRAIS